MSASAFIIWTIHKKNKELSWKTVMQLLLTNGWNINDHGKMTYLPLHDNDMYSWQREPIDEDKLIGILTEKEAAKESLGICITWKDSNIGGSLVTLNENEVMLSININRKTIKLYEGEIITDVNWYLARINFILSQREDIDVISIKFVETV